MFLMKAFLCAKKDHRRGNFLYGLTVYSTTGSVLHSFVLSAPAAPDKFTNHIAAYTWGLKKLKYLIQNKLLSNQEPLLLFISSKTVYGWFEHEVAPEPYTVAFSDLLMECSFVVNPLEVIYSKLADTKTLFTNSQQEQLVKVSDLFN